MSDGKSLNITCRIYMHAMISPAQFYKVTFKTEVLHCSKVIEYT